MSITVNSQSPLPVTIQSDPLVILQKDEQIFQNKVFSLIAGAGIIASVAIGIIFGPLVAVCTFLGTIALNSLIIALAKRSIVIQKPIQNDSSSPKLDVPEWLKKRETDSFRTANLDPAEKLKIIQYAQQHGLPYESISAHINKLPETLQ